MEPFAPHYHRCVSCGTLVCQPCGGAAPLPASTEGAGFYGREYWFSHQREDLGLPDIEERARLDLPERCLYWMRTLLTHKLPPSRTLDVGCSHGAFVSLLRVAGFDAMGLELSEWIVDYAERTFHVPMLRGPIEQQCLHPQSLDAISLNDVLEHLEDPLSTMRSCLSLLKPDGVLLVQTPCYPDPSTYNQLRRDDDVFLKMLLEDEHIYLFSRRSLRRLFESLGWPTVEFRTALFPYDQYAVVSQQPRAVLSWDDVVAALTASPKARMALAVLDLDDQFQQLRRRHADLEADRDSRIRSLEALSADNEARLQVILDHEARIAEQQATLAAVTRSLEALSADNEARLQVILDQQAVIRAVERHPLVRLLRYSRILRPRP